MEWGLGVIEHPQQLGLVGVQALEQTIKRGKAGAAAEDAVKAHPQLTAPARCWIEPVGFQVGIEPPTPSTCRTEVAMAYDESSVLVVTPKRRRR